MGGGMTTGMTSQTSQMLWAFRAGHQLGASPRAQIGAQILGVLVGAAVTVPVYSVVAASYGLGNEKMPAISALSWKATAQAMHGLATLPRVGRHRGPARARHRNRSDVLGRARIGRFLPSAAVIGVGFMLPFSRSLAAFAGALLAFAAQRLFRDLDQASVLASRRAASPANRSWASSSPS